MLSRLYSGCDVTHGYLRVKVSPPLYPPPHHSLKHCNYVDTKKRRGKKRSGEKRREEKGREAVITFTLLTLRDLDMSGETERSRKGS